MYLAPCRHALTGVSVTGVAWSTSSAFISAEVISLHGEASPPYMGAERSRWTFLLLFPRALAVVVVVFIVVVVAIEVQICSAQA